MRGRLVSFSRSWRVRSERFEGFTMRSLYVIVGVLVLIAAAFGIFWAAGHDFGTLQSAEFFPYDYQFVSETGETIRSSGAVVRVNYLEAASTDRAMANFMVAAQKMYPAECSGDNWEIAVRRPTPDGSEEKYSFSHYLPEGSTVPDERIEYGCWTNDMYVVKKSYEADWSEIARIAQGKAAFQIQVEQTPTAN